VSRKRISASSVRKRLPTSDMATGGPGKVTQTCRQLQCVHLQMLICMGTMLALWPINLQSAIAEHLTAFIAPLYIYAFAAQPGLQCNNILARTRSFRRLLAKFLHAHIYIRVALSGQVKVDGDMYHSAEAFHICAQCRAACL
jgi:hypothetical protein